MGSHTWPGEGPLVTAVRRISGPRTAQRTSATLGGPSPVVGFLGSESGFFFFFSSFDTHQPKLETRVPRARTARLI